MFFFFFLEKFLSRPLLLFVFFFFAISLSPRIIFSPCSFLQRGEVKKLGPEEEREPWPFFFFLPFETFFKQKKTALLFKKKKTLSQQKTYPIEIVFFYGFFCCLSVRLA